MTELKKSAPDVWEPKRTHLFTIEFPGLNISPYFFQDYKLYTEGEDFVFETNIFDSIQEEVNPAKFLKIKNVVINHLDPTGKNNIGGYVFKTEGIYYESSNSYAENEFLIHKLKLKIAEDTFKMINENK
jgi:hypothetical protein